MVVELQSAASCLRNGSNFSNVNQCLPAPFVIYGSRNAEEQKGTESAAESDFLANGFICDILGYQILASCSKLIRLVQSCPKIVCDQRSFTVLIVAHHVKLEVNSHLFQLVPCPGLPFWLELESTVVQQVLDKGSRRMEEPIPIAEVMIFLSINTNTL